ncbi:hypothetical protein [Stenotrophomonas acidaminiphila]|uniref:hypothetical protein n=1 Tax=Stenotrophomonas acidaminiphila TaxID=128780 RepID=UPI0039BD3A12
MIEARQVADLGFARLGLPVPMAKLVTIQSLGSALSTPSSEIFVEAMARWLGSRDLESECLEALCALLVTPVHSKHVARLRQAIPKPSIASDLIFSLVMDNQTLVPSWTGCHSGPVPSLLKLDKEMQELASGEFIPPVFGNSLESLEERTNFPFSRQWAFEYSVLRDRAANANEGYLAHFLESGRDHVGQFVTRRGHLARSAYLRTLACAADHWEMPADAALHFARNALPADPIFLRIAPHVPPAWASSVHAQATLPSGPESLVLSTIQQIEANLKQRIMHCSLPVIDTPLQHAELEIFAVARTLEELDAQHVVNFYRKPHVEYAPARDGLHALIPMRIEVEEGNRMPFLPVVMPILGDSLGYLQFHFLQRSPYLPLATASFPELRFLPGESKFNLRSDGKVVGSWQWWLWNWSPGQPRGWPAPIATCTQVTREAEISIENDLRARLDYVWCINAWSRESDHGKWKKTSHYGHIRR